MSEEKTAFFITPIGGADSNERKRSDAIKESMIKPALEGLAFKCVRADEFPEPGRIDIQVITMLLNADLVIADLSDRNANVFYELAVRHASQKAVILLCEEGQSLPFDIFTHRTIFYDLHDGPKFFQAQKELRRQVEAVTTDEFVPDSPIKEALLQRAPQDISALKEVTTIVRTNASLLNDLQNEIKSIKNNFDKLYDTIRLSRMRELAREELDTFEPVRYVPSSLVQKNIVKLLKDSGKPMNVKELFEITHFAPQLINRSLHTLTSANVLKKLGDGTYVLTFDLDDEKEGKDQ